MEDVFRYMIERETSFLNGANFDKGYKKNYLVILVICR